MTAPETAARQGSGAHRPETTSFRALKIVLRLLCILPFGLGAADLFGGARFLATAGAVLSEESISDPILNNQIKFWGAIWLGWGVALWWVTNDLRSRSPMLRILLATLILSGLSRALSVLLYGWASPPLTIAMVIEIAGSSALMWWHSRATRLP